MRGNGMDLIVYTLGIITGLLLAIIWLIASNIMPYKPSKILGTIQTPLKRKGEVLLPKDEITEARDRMIKEKHDAGLDVFLDDLPKV